MAELTSRLIMLIDDNEVELYISNRLLVKHAINYKVVSFNMANDAIEYLKKNSDSANLIPEIILCDIHMPQMSGFGFLDAYDNLPEMVKSLSSIYMISSTFDKEDIERSRNNKNVNEFYEKPLTKEKIEFIINSSNQSPHLKNEE